MTNTWTPALAALDPPVLEETAAALLKFGSGQMALIDNSRRAPTYDERMEAFTAARGPIRFGVDPSLDPEYTAALTQDPFIRFADAYRLQMDHFADVARVADACPAFAMEVTREDAIDVARIAQMLTDSAEKSTVEK